MYDRKLRDWENIRHLTCPDVDTPEKYEQLARKNHRLAERFLEERTSLTVPSVDDICAVHKHAFRKIYPFAGKFREKDHHVGAGPDPNQSAFYQRIAYELERLADHIRPLVGHRSTEPERAHAITLFHLQYERIHPFQEGNGRSGRLLTQAHTRSLLHKEPHPTTDREGYLKGLRDAEKERDLRGLCKALTGVSLPPSLAKTTYSLELWPAPVEKRTEKGTRFRVEAPDIDTAEDIDDARLTRRLEREIDSNPNAPAPPMDINFSKRPIILDLDKPREKLRDLGLDR